MEAATQISENSSRKGRKRVKPANSRSRANQNYYQRNRETLLAKANERYRRLYKEDYKGPVKACDLMPKPAESPSPKRLSWWGSLRKSLGMTG